MQDQKAVSFYFKDKPFARVILVGKSCAGKDTLLYQLVSKYKLKQNISTTTRPPRDNEIHGVHYYFVNETDFHSMEFMDTQKHKINGVDYYYGCTASSVERSQILILPPKSLKSISEQTLKDSLIVFLDCNGDVRLKRMLARKGSIDDPERRMAADEIDFKGFENYHMKIVNEGDDSSVVLTEFEKLVIVK